MNSLYRAGLLLGAGALIGCTGSSDTDLPDDAPAAAQPAASTSTAVPTAPGAPSSEAPATDVEPSETVEATATAMREPVKVTAAVSGDASPTACAPGDSIDVQKTKMLDILTAQFSGKTAEGRPRLQFGPDSRDHRQGGIWMVLEFNGEVIASFQVGPVKNHMYVTAALSRSADNGSSWSAPAISAIEHPAARSGRITCWC